ncbi:hypothetical protein [Companilactobacillus furfuricola]|uniref:hypothetical protein n=1 Tax=Companilactobacillus furfuricola TaxID=1462575 RepID=UPI0013DE1FB6|nr:hypothetical protein [Companilactobacillus furfuricola]
MRKYIMGLIAFFFMGIVGVCYSNTADAAVFNDPSTGYSTVQTDYPVAVTNFEGAKLYDENGRMSETLKLGTNTLWYTDYARIRLSDGEVFFRVSTNEFVNEKDVSTTYVNID